MHTHGVGTIVVGLILALSACSDQFKFPFPPTMPKWESMVQDQKDFDAQWKAFADLNSIDSSVSANQPVIAQQFVTAGYRVSYSQCKEFFRTTKEMQAKNNYWKDNVVSASSAAGTILGLASAPVSVLTGVFGASGLIPKAVDDFNSIFLLSTASDELGGTVTSGMEKFQADNAVSQLTCTGKSDCQTQANTLVRKSANFCTIDTLLALVKTSVQNMCMVDSSSPTGANCQSAGGTPNDTKTTGQVTTTTTKNADGSVSTQITQNTKVTATAPAAKGGTPATAPATSAPLAAPITHGIGQGAVIGKSGSVLFVRPTQ